MQETSVITLKESALINNIRFLKKKLGKNVKISSVVKANAYGHGIEQMVPMLEKAGINHFSVFNFDEAQRVCRSLTKKSTVVIMGYISNEHLREAIEKNFEFFVFNLERLEVALEEARNLGKPAKIHIEVETGMNRTGLNMNELIEAINVIKMQPENFEVEGFCTHLAGAESVSNYVRIQKQIKRYRQMSAILEKSDIRPRYRHVANSAAAFVYPAARFDLVRIGIMQYGFWPSAETFIHFINHKKNRTDPLHRILGWESKVMSVKIIKTGEFVGYGNHFLAQQETLTALVPVGYATGYSRSLSNKGRVLIRGRSCNVIGVVNMNMVVVDISAIPEVKIGDQVVIIGRQGDTEINVSAFSDISNALNYEVLSRLPLNIERRVIPAE
ncbi:alanine racemase [Prolixibacter sp. SD074]|jgi:alanine racemase|uniref:alanine racemase n=1 Tax=Prolixibacter sp. SD074 TaxID=2652391 RepID=UPI001283F9D0|nr:alanine racemase [Prolixibacter sp. SD074]GET28564.1 alanine racemase [Prolixibacter sp. SD074]